MEDIIKQNIINFDILCDSIYMHFLRLKINNSYSVDYTKQVISINFNGLHDERNFINLTFDLCGFVLNRLGNNVYAHLFENNQELFKFFFDEPYCIHKFEQPNINKIKELIDELFKLDSLENNGEIWQKN